MRALVFDGTLHMDDRPEPGGDESLVKVRLAGVCNTDLEILKGYMGFSGVLGHEFVGTAINGSLSGQRVVGEINCPCHACFTCREINPRHCPERTVLGIQGRDGAFAEYLKLPDRNLHPVPPEVPDRAAVFTEPLAAAIEITEQVEVSPSMQTAVIGDGKLGFLVAQVLRHKGVAPVVLGRSRARVDGAPKPSTRKLRLLSEMGFTTLCVGEDDRTDLPTAAFDLVVEASGSPGGLQTAMRMVRPRGTIVLKSTYRATASVDFAPLVINEVILVGSRCGPFPAALEFLQKGVVDCESMVEEIYPLRRGVEALQHAARPDTLKILIDCSTVEG